MSALIGRAPERERLDRLVAERGGAMALVGEPGIGKTALLDYARGRAERVLSATGAEAEADLPFAGLLALLRPVLHHVDQLPPVQGRALEGALAIGPPAPADRLVVHAAALGVLSAAAEEEPLLAVVDDAHWLDDASADALLFSARRLGGEPVALLLALRPVEGRRLDLAGVERVPVDGLAREEAAALLPDLPADVVARLHAATAGNPLALLEAPGHLPPGQLAGRDPLGDPLPVGPAVQVAFRRRLEALPESTRTALALVAAAGAESFERVEAAARKLGVTLDDLAPAERDHLVELAPDTVRFRHPLVRAAAYQDAPAPERRAVHAALAAHTEGARRANHLYAAAAGPDAEAASALEDAAGEARGRTGYSAAAIAMERAAQLTPAGQLRAARRLAAAQDRLVGGDAAHAVTLARAALTDTRAPRLAAEINGLLGAIEMLAGSLDAGVRTCSAAAESIAASDPQRAAWLFETAALSCMMSGRLPEGHDICARAFKLGGPQPAIGIMLAGARVLIGDGEVHSLLDRWPEVVDPSILIPGAPHLIGTLQALGWVERYDDADAFAERVDALVASTGAIGALPLLRGGQGEIDFRRGEWARARARLSESIRLAVDTGQVVQAALPTAIMVRIEAAMGLEAECRATVAGMLAGALEAGADTLSTHAETALGLLELGLGRAERAVEHLERAFALSSATGLRDPNVIQFHPDRVEAHLRAGDLTSARAALAEFEALGDRLRRVGPAAAAARCRGMLEDDFEPWFERAYADRSQFELGRTELVHGERLRRARRVREAREKLRSAVERFEALGAAPWAARARAELRAAGGAVGPARATATRDLTPQELEVALAVARGATNREVAAALFVSPKTVEVHLSRIFKKLGVRSRTEMARLLNE